MELWSLMGAGGKYVFSGMKEEIKQKQAFEKVKYTYYDTETTSEKVKKLIISRIQDEYKEIEMKERENINNNEKPH